MKKKLFSSLLLSIGILTAITNSVEAQETENGTLVGLDNKESLKQITTELKKENISFDSVEDINLLKVYGDSGNRVLKKFDANIEWSGPDEKVLSPQKSLVAPVFTNLEKENNAYDEWRWDIDEVTNNKESYKIEKGTHDVKVAIIDSGIDFNHPDLKNNIISTGKSFVPGENSTEDNLGHGTMVAGVIAANGNIKGVAPEIGIVPYKVFKDGTADSSWIIEAIVEAANDDMDVINMSLGTYKSLKLKEDQATIKAYKKAIKYANKKGSLVVASSGTEGFDLTSPKNLATQLGKENDVLIHLPGGGTKGVITVSATNNKQKLADYSNFGSQINIAAPAGDYGDEFETEGKIKLKAMTITTYPTSIPQSLLSQQVGFEHGYEFMIGTSLAVPKVTGVAALIISEYKEKYGKKPSVKQVENYLYKGVNKVNLPNNQIGEGITNAHKSLKLIQGGI